MNKSMIGEALALPGYIEAAIVIRSEEGDAIIAPPTGTRKFLSVLWITAALRRELDGRIHQIRSNYSPASTRPTTTDLLIILHMLLDCIP